MGICQSSGRDHLNLTDAFARYEAVRHRLPMVQAGVTSQKVENLDFLAEHMDVFLLDAFGVLNIGETAIAGVPERVAALQKAGKRVMVVSNAAGYPHAMLMEKYKRLGYDFAPEDVITSRKATLHALHQTEPGAWGLMATESLGRGDIEPFDMRYLDEDAAAYGEVEAFVLLGSANWTETRQSLLEAALKRAPRPVYVGNPDIVAPREHGFSVEPGLFAHRLADQTGVEPQFFGKPFGNIFDLAFAQLGTVDRERTVMVGDSLHTDILGGQAAGVRTALIAGYGFFAGHDVDVAIEASGIRPDFILQRP
ncbi:HAD-IIA family hydrolase [Sulfitobacter sp. F26204]|uniref:HAD-IIA family hydrolase n=1 Tax=Sulfitobacter sp. F26204 TaxID=2996014 RepID=UPI00225DE838|nr:HAD-IIA family hydrolase [Sulfitobacter sp. F26204]MCX7560747.1 HAD-IIA family hydrolase [Sulfitobacter sp. F26204]